MLLYQAIYSLIVKLPILKLFVRANLFNMNACLFFSNNFIILYFNFHLSSLNKIIASLSRLMNASISPFEN